MTRLPPQATATLALLLTGVMCVASVTPYMAVHIVETLGREPWEISLYAVPTLLLTVLVNRQFGEWIDAGVRVAPLILASIVAFAVAVVSVLLWPGFGALLWVAAPCFAVGNAAVTAMYGFGRAYAEREGLDVTRYNSLLRAMTSLGWMIAPAAAFTLASVAGDRSVFWLALALCAVWGLLWWRVMPKDFCVVPERPEDAGHPAPVPEPVPLEAGAAAAGIGILSAAPAARRRHNLPLLWGAGVCLAFAMAHSMSTAALPLFYLREAGLPGYAPGLSLSVKTALEIVAILSTPAIIARLGVRNALRIAALLSICAFFVLSRVTTLPGLVFGAALEGAYYGTFAAVGMTYMQGFARGRYARATSLYMNSLFVGSLLASPLMGLTAQVASFGLAVQLATVWSVLAFAILTWLTPARIAALDAA